MSLVPVTSRHAGWEVPLWWGKWNSESTSARAGHLFIREVGPSGFLFNILVISGSHTGDLSGYAQFVSRDLAYARLENGASGQICEIKFQRRTLERRRLIDLEETSPCTHFRGMRVYFSGEFSREHESLFNGGYLDELDLQRLYSMTGKYYEGLTGQFQNISVRESLDPFPAQVFSGGVSGLYTIRQGIVMRGFNGELWAAFIDDTVVRYFTTQSEFKTKLPVTIENWREGFRDKEVVMHDNVDFIPKLP